MRDHLKVLVVDDDPTLLELLQVFLESRRYRVETCSSGEEAVSLLEQRDFDLIVSDIAMAGMDGLQLIRRIREESPQTCCILMTAFSREHPRKAAKQAGADAYITKPFGMKKFAAVFERAYWNALLRREGNGGQHEGPMQPRARA